MTTHVDELAARLRELKERSGRSYGQLATRLHVSTSTLHRYCNAAAVPTDYAPVERLARLCGATPEELITLHRHWLLADAARREPDRSAEEPAAGAETPTEAVPQTPAAATTDTAAGPATRPAAPEPAPRRSRRTALVLGAVAAIAVLATLPVALHGGGDGNRNRGAAPPLTTQGRTGALTAAPRTYAERGAEGSSSPVPTGPTSPSTAATAGSGTTSTPLVPASGGDSDPAPFQVNVLTDNWNRQCGQWFLLPQQPGKVPPPPSLDRTDAWASALGGIPAGHLRLELTAQTGATRPIVLHALYVRVVSSNPAPKGSVYTPGSGCGSGLDPAAFAVDLDAATPRTTPVPGEVGHGGTKTLSDFPYRISATDPQVLDVDASTVGQDVSWYLKLSWSSGDRSGEFTVDDDGRPFRTVGLQGDPAYFYDGTAWSPTTVWG